MSNDDFLKSFCNRYVNGQCQTLACLKRGGYRAGMKPDYNLATCGYHEVLLELRILREENKCLGKDLDRALYELGAASHGE